MLRQLRAALVSFALLSALTGIAYPLLVTGVADAAFPKEASGSLIESGGKVMGSTLIGQSFDEKGYFWGRLSATARMPYNAGLSSGSNLGPSNKALLDAVKGRVDALIAADPDNKAPIPVDLVTASGSGLDPQISPAAAEYQVARVARARGISEKVVRGYIAKATEGRGLGFLGEPGVNVLVLNRLIDAGQ